MTKTISLVVGILIGITTLAGVGWKLDCRWSRPSMEDHEILAGDMRAYEMRNVQKELWMYEDRYRGVPEQQWHPADLQRYRILKVYLQCLREGRKNCGFY